MADSDDHSARHIGGILAGQILAMIALASGLIETGLVDATAFIRSLEMQREKLRIESSGGYACADGRRAPRIT